MIVWKQTERIISAGEVLLRKDARMSLIKTPNGINLQIANVTPDDRGKSMWKMQGKLPRDAYYNSTTPFSSFLALGFSYILERG